MILPITLVEPQLQLLCHGRLDRLFRPRRGTLERLGPGDRLWVREPFHLHHKWNGLSPSAAEQLGALPEFAADGASENDWHLGPRRFARNLLRVWHRQHLVVDRVEHRRLQTITQQEVRMQGFTSPAQFAAAWDRNLSLNQGGIQGRAGWFNDPEVLVIHFTRIPAPLPPALLPGEPA